MREPLPEILDNVLSWLHPEDWESGWNEPFYGKRDLHNCSMVSHSWHFLAQRHLFRNIVYLFLRTPDDITLLEGQSPLARYPTYGCFSADRPGTRCKTLPMLLSFLGERPALRFMIHRLRLEACPADASHLDWASTKQFAEEDCVDTSLFLRLLAFLPNLSTLHLCNVVLSQDPPPDSSISLPPLSRLYVSYRTELYRTSWSWHYTSNFVRTYRLLACFSKLDELHLHALGDLAFFIKSPNGERRMAQLNLAIRSLILESVSTSSGMVYEAFIQSPLAHSLRCLIHSNMISALGRQNFLRQVGPNLTQLRYELPIFLHSRAY